MLEFVGFQSVNNFFSIYIEYKVLMFRKIMLIL